MSKLLGVIAAALLGLAVLALPAGSVPAHSYVVSLRSGNPSTIAASHGESPTHVYRTALRGYSAVMTAEQAAALARDPRVATVAPDRTVSVTVQAQTQVLGTGVDRINAESKANKGGGVNVAIIDTGIQRNHPDLSANVVGGYNCSTGGASHWTDGFGHGTYVSGIVAAEDNTIGTVGVAPNVKLWGVRVLNNNGSGSTSDVACGIDFVDSLSPAKGGPITVANMSLGGGGRDDGNCGHTNGDIMHQAVCSAVADGVTFVVAAGNSTIPIQYFVPASYDEVITVTALADSDGAPCGQGATTQYGADDTFATFSDYADNSADLAHTIAGPGVNIYSEWKGSLYETHSGTSASSPHVAGSAALYVKTHPGATPAQVLTALQSLSEPPNTNFNSECSGSGKHGHSSHTATNQHPEGVVRADTL